MKTIAQKSFNSNSHEKPHCKFLNLPSLIQSDIEE